MAFYAQDSRPLSEIPAAEKGGHSKAAAAVAMSQPT